MATKKITLNELRSIVKQIIKEETSREQEEEREFLSTRMDKEDILIDMLIKKLKQTPEGNNVIKNLGIETITRLSNNMYHNGNRSVEVQSRLLIKRYGDENYENSEQKLERYRNSEYYLNGKRVYPEIDYYDHYLRAWLDDRVYELDAIGGKKDKFSLRLKKGNSGIYTQ